MVLRNPGKAPGALSREVKAPHPGPCPVKQPITAPFEFKLPCSELLWKCFPCLTLSEQQRSSGKPEMRAPSPPMLQFAPCQTSYAKSRGNFPWKVR